MVTIAQKLLKSAQGKPAQAPISAHPLFGTLVALWFAALFGLCSLVLPARIFESLLGAIGLSGLVPLGLGMRFLIALLACALGGMIGLSLTRRFAPNSPKRETEEAEEPVASARARKKRGKAKRAPLLVQEETDEAPLPPPIEAAPEPQPRRRRFLMQASEAPEETSPIEISDASAEESPLAAVPAQFDEADTALVPEPVSEAAMAPEPEAAPALPALQPAPVRFYGRDYIGDAGQPADATASMAPAWPGAGEAPQKPLSQHDVPDLADFTHPNRKAPATDLHAAPPVLSPAPEAETAQPAARPRRPISLNRPVPITERPLERLGMVELVERLAHAIYDEKGHVSRPVPKRAYALATIAANSPIMANAPAAAPEESDAASHMPPSDAAAMAGVAPFSSAFRPLASLDQSAPDAQAEEPLATNAPPPASPPYSENPAFNGAAPRFHSPVANMATERLPRGEQEADDPEQALRDALAALQRISGTG